MIEAYKEKQLREIVKKSAPDLYLCNLLLPKQKAKTAFNLHAFHVELTNITMKAPVTKGTVGGKEDAPLPAEIKLKWWQEVLEGQREPEHPLAKTLLETKELKPYINVLAEKAIWHKVELADEIKTCQQFETWAGKTRSIIFQILAGEKAAADASGHAGVAWACIWALQNQNFFKEKKQFIPKELTLTEMLEYTNEHIKKAKQSIKSLKKPTKKIFLLIQLLSLYQKAISKNPENLMAGAKEIWQAKKQWQLLRASICNF